MAAETTSESECLDDPRAEVARLRERVAALEAELAVLRPSEAELRAMFKAMNDVVLVMNREGRYLRIGDTAPDLLYRPPDHLVGQRMHDVMPAEAAEFFLKHIRQALDEQRVVSMDYSLPLEDREVWFSANISPLGGDSTILVCRDVTERKRHEQVLQDSLRQQELLRAQEAALMRLSTPLIPISDDIVVMPLVGRLDRGRVEHAMQTVLDGVQRSRAAVAILDITGVADIDAAVAGALVQLARAVGLLGAAVVLTGIRPEVAGTLVSLGADLTGLVTRGTLQDGIRHAQTEMVRGRART